MERDLLMLMRPQLQVQTLMLKLMLMLGRDTMERDPLMKKLQLPDQTLMLRLILIMDTDMDITDRMDTMVTDMAMDITDHTDTGDTMERDLLMKPQLLDQTLMLMLMPGMVIMVMDMVMDITDHMDTMVMDTGERSKLAALFNQMTTLFFKC